MRNRIVLAAAVLSLSTAVGLGSAPALAFGGGTSNPPTTVKKCKKGYVWSTRRGKCVRLRKGELDNEELYAQGWQLAKSGDYEKAIAVLSLADQNDPRVLNYLGYSHRKLGDLETGVQYYKKALEIDPDFVLAREYLGEGYVAAGKLSLARAELAEIEKRCGQKCEEYQELAAVIAGAVKKIAP